MLLSEITYSPLEASIMEMVLLMDSDDIINEGMMSKLLDKTGMKLTKGTSLFSYIKSSGKGIGKMFIAAIRGDKDGIKAVMSEVNKQDMMDFLMKLDTATMGLVTGPIRMIEAITGWGLSANIKIMASATKAAKAAIETVKTNINTVMDKAKVKVYNGYLTRIEKELV